MNRVSRGLFVVALVFLVLSIGLEFTGSREAVDGDLKATYTGSDPWAVDSVRPGEVAAPHLDRLGPPRKDVAVMGDRVLTWSSPDLMLTLDAGGVVKEAWGRRLSAGELTLIASGASQEEVERRLGRGRVQKTTRPRGSGVISIGSVEVARILTYEAGGVRFEITIEDDQVKHIRALALAAGVTGR